MFRKHIAHGAASNAEKSTSRQSVQKACHEHSLDIARNCARNHEDEEESEGANIDGTPAVELCAPISNLVINEGRGMCQESEAHVLVGAALMKRLSYAPQTADSKPLVPCPVPQRTGSGRACRSAV
jgi:hypothetical protein